MTRDKELTPAGLLEDADELLARCNRYLSEFGTVDPNELSARIKAWRDRLAISRAMDGAAALAAMPDSEIDTSDIAETTDWSGATRGRFANSGKDEE